MLRYPILLAAALVLVTSASAFADGPSSGSGCSAEIAWTAPAALEAACTAVLANPDLPPHDRADALYARARGYQFGGRMKLAAADFDAALTIAPDFVEAMVSRADLYRRAGAYSAGNHLLVKAIAADPKNAHAYRELGNVALDQGQVDDAIDSFTRALALDPAESVALSNRIDAYMRANRFKEALADVDALVAMPLAGTRSRSLDYRGRIVDLHVTALDQRASLYVQLDQPDKAIADYDAAVAYQPDSVDALYERGTYLSGISQFGRALADADRIIALDPSDQTGHLLRATAMLGRGDYRDALVSANRVIELNPRSATAYQYRAGIDKVAGRIDDGVRDMEMAMSLDGGVAQNELIAVREAGYWRSRGVPATLTPAFDDAIRACMIDTDCQ